MKKMKILKIIDVLLLMFCVGNVLYFLIEFCIGLSKMDFDETFFNGMIIMVIASVGWLTVLVFTIIRHLQKNKNANCNHLKHIIKDLRLRYSQLEDLKQKDDLTEYGEGCREELENIILHIEKEIGKSIDKEENNDKPKE